MYSSAHLDVINFSDEEETATESIFWNEEVDGNHYTESGMMDNNCGENAIRCNKIEEIRDKYTAPKKVGRDWYEKHNQFTYRSFEDYKKCMKEIEDKGLSIKAEPRKPPVDIVSILWRDPNDKRGRDPATGEDPDDYYSKKDLNKYQKDTQVEDDKL